MKKKYEYIIGIDPGVITGYALWEPGVELFRGILGVKIHTAMEFVAGISDHWDNVFIRVEDARKRKWFGDNSAAKKQGAGSIKRDCKIWEDFLTDLGVDFEMIHPLKGGTKMDAKTFKKLTGWEKQTNNHGRDAAMIVFGYK